jgi:hypothetical protein
MNAKPHELDKWWGVLSTPSSCAHQAEQAAAVMLRALRLCIETQSRQRDDLCAGLPSSLINPDWKDSSTSRLELFEAPTRNAVRPRPISDNLQ